MLANQNKVLFKGQRTVRKAKKLDEVDAVILKTLLINSITSFTAIAKTCKISVAAVKRRIERLRKESIYPRNHVS